MPFNKKLTMKHGAKRHQVTIAAGSDIAGTSDGVEINIEQTVMTKAEALDLVDKMRGQILTGPWPL